MAGGSIDPFPLANRRDLGDWLLPHFPRQAQPSAGVR